MANQFRAEPGIEYVNPVTTQRVVFTSQDLTDPAIGFLSDQFKKATEFQATATPTSAVNFGPTGGTYSPQTYEQRSSISLPSGTITASPDGTVEAGGNTLAERGTADTLGLDYIRAVQDSSASTDSITSFLLGLQKQNQALQQQVLSANKPSAREEELEKKEGDIIASTRAGLTDVEGRPIPIQLIQGEQALLRQQSLDILEPIQRELEREGSKRRGMVDTLKTALGFQRENQAFQVELLKELRKPVLEAKKRVQDYISDLASKYPDAGISFNDTAESAAGKVVQNSRIYRLEIQRQEQEILRSQSLTQATGQATAQKLQAATKQITGAQKPVARKSGSVVRQPAVGRDLVRGTPLSGSESAMLSFYPTEFRSWWRNQTVKWRRAATTDDVQAEFERWAQNRKTISSVTKVPTQNESLDTLANQYGF